jgi:peroxiredoxin
MMRRSILFLVAFLFTFLTVRAQQLTDIPLRTLDGKRVGLSSSNKKLTVVVFLSPECPLSQSYILNLNRIQQQNASLLQVVGIFPGTSYSYSDYITFRDKYKVNFDLFVDSSKSLVKALAALVTPEVFLLDTNFKVLYAGAIDNWAIDLGTKRYAASEHYLPDAIAAYVAGEPIILTRKKAIGCFISDL